MQLRWRNKRTKSDSYRRSGLLGSLVSMSKVRTSLLAFMLTIVPTVQAHAQAAPCRFTLGFQTLHDLAPGDVGDCIDNQAFTANGDARQHTTKGLMAWRKADNWTVFTNGYVTWINGPDGLIRRLNTQYFPWEIPLPGASLVQPVVAAGIPMDRATYLNRVQSDFSDMRASTETFTQLIGNVHQDDPLWRKSLSTEILKWNRVYLSTTTVVPPADLSPFEQAWLSYLADMCAIGADLTAWINGGDASHLADATGKRTEANTLLTKVSQLFHS